MGQKINSNIFQLGIKKKEWDSKYFENTKEEYSLYTYQSLEIKKFLHKFLKNNGLFYHDLKLHYSNNTLYLFISYYTSSKISSLINKTNEYQKIQIIKKKNYKRKKKNFRITTIIPLKKLRFQFQKFIKQPNQKIQNNLKKLYTKKITHKKTKKHFEKKLKKRIRIVTDYKNTLQMNTCNNIQHLKINNFSEQLLESLSILTNKKFNIFLTFEYLNKKKRGSLSFDKTQKNLVKKNLLRLQQVSRNRFFKETINIILITILKKNSAQLLAEFISYQLSTLKKHDSFLIFTKRFLISLISEKKISKISGVKIIIRGRFNGTPRARKRIYVAGNAPTQTLNSNISYHQAISYTPNGTFGIKVWICKKNKYNKKCFYNQKN
jgi:ribosomal protein S3